MGCLMCENVEECKEAYKLIQQFTHDIDECSMDEIVSLKKRFKVVNDAEITSLFTLELELEGVYDLRKEKEIYERITSNFNNCPVGRVIYAENCIYANDQNKKELQLAILTHAANKGYWKAYGVLGEYAYRGEYGRYIKNNQLAIKYFLKSYELCNENNSDKSHLAVSLADLYSKEGNTIESNKWMNVANSLCPGIQPHKHVISTLGSGGDHVECPYIQYSDEKISQMRCEIVENIPVEIKIAKNSQYIDSDLITCLMPIIFILIVIFQCFILPFILLLIQL